MVEIGTAQSQKTGDRAAREPDRFHLFLFMRPSSRGPSELLRSTSAPRSPIVDAVLEGALNGFRRELEEKMGVPSGIVEASSLNKALKEARLTYLENVKQNYSNKSLFAFEDHAVGNRWLWHDARFMSDGDRSKGLRLRTNLFLTRTLSNRHSKDASVRLCRRCHKAPETTFHILQACEVNNEPRCSRLNFICKAITKKIHSLHPDAGISTDRLLVTSDGVRLRPDIVVELKNKTFILDVAVAWDAMAETLEAMCTYKQKSTPLLSPFSTSESLRARSQFYAWLLELMVSYLQARKGRQRKLTLKRRIQPG
ncbi:hypothetical protein HPB51_027612 [Rhipicephalus microplus]|uniref:Reverse transcriptase n=1 Tax=Rhipicephalus microplus TaxID=6941 RepID=A0A9J6CZX3_RHIMP|nr:hypothetical protein HPB51_027612 [Rhipicephalus microplus]